MIPKVAFIHTSATLIPVFEDLCNAFLPTVNRCHISDDSLIKDVIESGCLSPGITRRVVQHVISAESAGASSILVTCSSIGPAVELAQHLVDVPVHRVDLAMADKAISLGQRIGVLATLPTTLHPTTDLLRRRAASLNEQSPKEPVTIVAKLCEGAFDFLMEGKCADHDTLVRQGLLELAEQVDVIVLAQASMARVALTIGAPELAIPVLSSPEPAIRRMADSIKALL